MSEFQIREDSDERTFRGESIQRSAFDTSKEESELFGEYACRKIQPWKREGCDKLQLDSL